MLSGVCRKDDLKLVAGRFDFQKPKQQIEYLSELGTESVAAIASFEISPGVNLCLRLSQTKPPTH